MSAKYDTLLPTGVEVFLFILVIFRNAIVYFRVIEFIGDRESSYIRGSAWQTEISVSSDNKNIYMHIL